MFSTSLVYGKPLSYQRPYGTELIKKSSNKNGGETVYLFKYVSDLSKEKILDFYRNLFAKQNMVELDKETNNISESAYIFKGDLEKATVFFLPSFKKGVTNYCIFARSQKTASKNFSKRVFNKALLKQAKSEKKAFEIFGYISPPKAVGFMPMQEGIRQLTYASWEDSQPRVIGIGYVTSRVSPEVVNFYLENMPGFGWGLSERKSNKGTYTISQWFPIIAPYSPFCPTCEGILPLEVPPLKVYGETLTFVREGQKCVITAYTFADILEIAEKQTVYDISFMKKYGTTIITVVYFY
ncbi:MAG: hypothetical protein WCY34_04060 [Candidatus Omnitrophota bacterium]